MEKIVLNANERKTITKPALNSVRNNKRVPGTFYLKNSKPVSIDVLEKELNPLVFTADTHLISLNVEGLDEHECVIKDVQFDPVTDRVVHFDLLGLVKGEMFQLEVPIKYHGSAIGIKEGGILQQVIHKLEIECLPKNIPSHLDVDVTDIKLGAAIHAGDLKFENINVLTPADAVVVTVTHPKVEKEPVVEELVEGAVEPEVIPKGKAEEEEERKRKRKRKREKKKKRNNLSPCVLSLALEIRELGIHKPGIILVFCSSINMRKKILLLLLPQKTITFLQKEKPPKAVFPLLSQLPLLIIVE